eukprot:2868997-Amphidinium_carterae.1
MAEELAADDGREERMILMPYLDHADNLCSELVQATKDHLMQLDVEKHLQGRLIKNGGVSLGEGCFCTPFCGATKRCTDCEGS